MPLLHSFDPLEAKAKEAIDENLMDLKYKENIENLADQIDALSIGGSGGSVDTGVFGEITLGGETNEGVYWKRRFSPFQNQLNQDPENIGGFDPEGKDLKNEMLAFLQSNDAGITRVADAPSYLGELARISKDSTQPFRIKKGINFISIGHGTYSSSSDSITPLIDGQTLSSLGLRDENGDLLTDTFSSNSATTFYQKAFFIYGLDGDEHTLTIKNTDSASKNFDLHYMEVGYRTENPTLNEKIKISKGKALVRGAEATIAESELTFGKLNKNGHTGSIVLDNSDNTLSVLDGESPAMTQCRAEVEVDFTSPVSTLDVKNNWYFPDSGICMMSTPWGAHHLFSYASKTDALIQAHSFNAIQWQSQPTEAMTPLSGFGVAVASGIGDLNINYWGTAPISITSSNNKLDFTVTIAGVTTTHVATIATGRYAANIVSISDAVNKSMQAVKAISGTYLLKYSDKTQLYSISVDDSEVEALELLFSSGVNVVNSIHTTLGFGGSDFTGSVSYNSTIEVQHLSAKVFEKSNDYINGNDPRVKRSKANGNTAYSTKLDLEQRLSFPNIYTALGATLLQMYPEDDCCGLRLDFLKNEDGQMMTVSIDDGPYVYLTLTCATTITSGRGQVLSGFISFPKGSRKISIRMESDAFFEITNRTEYMTFIGAEQYTSKPAWEKLTLTQAIIKEIEISPQSLYAHIYGANGGITYSPTGGSTDLINTINEVGSWTGDTTTSVFNAGRRYTTATGAYMDVNFTLTGDGGGILLQHIIASSLHNKASLFLSSSAINESTDRITTNTANTTIVIYDQKGLGVVGLPAGTYTARFKNEGGVTTMENGAIVVIDTVPAEENKNTVSDLTPAGAAVIYPLNVKRQVAQKDSAHIVPNYLSRTGYKEGRVSLISSALSSPTFSDYEDSANILGVADSFYSQITSENQTGCYHQLAVHCKSLASLDLCDAGGGITVVTPSVDGVSTLNTYSQRVQVKGGSAPSSSRSSTSRLVVKDFNISCTHASGNTYNVADTRGFKNGAEIILFDGTNKENLTILSFVVGVSFTTKETPATIVPANVTKIEFQGFHNLKIEASNGTNLNFLGFEYEPLTLQPSSFRKRLAQENKYERVSKIFKDVANLDDLHYPTHSDGVQGSWTTSTIEILSTSVANFWDFPQDLKNVSVSSGTIDVRITSERLVPVLDNKERF